MQSVGRKGHRCQHRGYHATAFPRAPTQRPGLEHAWLMALQQLGNPPPPPPTTTTTTTKSWLCSCSNTKWQLLSFIGKLSFAAVNSQQQQQFNSHSNGAVFGTAQALVSSTRYTAPLVVSAQGMVHNRLESSAALLDSVVCLLLSWWEQGIVVSALLPLLSCIVAFGCHPCHLRGECHLRDGMQISL